MIDKNISVLIIIDFPKMGEILKEMLEDMGFSRIDIALDGKDGLDKALCGNYGLILSEIHLHCMNGLNLLKNLRKVRTEAELPFIFVTTETDFKTVVNAKILGANGYVTKPFTSTILRNKIESVLSGINKKDDMTNCWEFMRCGKESGRQNIDDSQPPCPASTLVPADGFCGGKNGGRACVYIQGTYRCHNKCTKDVYTVKEKLTFCTTCQFYLRLKKEHEEELKMSNFVQYLKKNI